MGQSAILSEREQANSGALVRSSGFETLQELTRHGYVTQPLPNSDGILLRHRSAPDLILHADGAVEVPLGQPVKRQTAGALDTPPRRKRRWLRALLLVIGLALYTMFAFSLIGAIMEAMEERPEPPSRIVIQQ